MQTMAQRLDPVNIITRRGFGIRIGHRRLPKGAFFPALQILTQRYRPLPGPFQIRRTTRLAFQ